MPFEKSFRPMKLDYYEFRNGMKQERACRKVRPFFYEMERMMSFGRGLNR